MLLRVFAIVFALSASAAAASHRPVCPGPEADGTARCHARVITDERGKPNANLAPSGYSPLQFRTAYALPSTTNGKGQTIAIVDAYNDPNIEKDLGTYDSHYGLPACTTANGCFKKVNQTGGTSYPLNDSGWSLEISLDVEIAHAACPNCKILLVEATSNSFSNLLTAEDYAVRHATVVSNSWGSSEFSGEISADSHFNHIGHPITFSAGDDGYGVEYPASSEYVTAVGGTTLTLNSNNTYKSESVWGGTGSGCSAYEPKPTWQKDSGCIRRTSVDVAADANPVTGAAVYDSVRYQGVIGWFQVGGTSLSSPLVASAYALAGNAASTVDGSYPYAHGSSLHDVTSGSNGSCGGLYLCTGKVGYDGPTGKGTPKGVAGF